MRNPAVDNNRDHKYLSFNRYTTGWEIFLGTHTVICDENNQPMAVTATCHAITHHSLTKLGVAFNRMLHDNIKQKQSFFLNLTKQYATINLTPR